jgi:hypothetical protein
MYENDIFYQQFFHFVLWKKTPVLYFFRKSFFPMEKIKGVSRNHNIKTQCRK